MRPGLPELLLALALVAGPAAAETLYVTDKLRLGVHAKADTSDGAFVSLNSGDAVEVLERNGSYVRVRLDDGREGWVRGAFLVADPPAVRRLAGLEAERDRLATELAELAQRTEGSAEAAVSTAPELAALRESEREARELAGRTREELARWRREAQRLQQQSAPDSLPLGWLGLLGFVAFVLGAYTAWRWFDYRSRRRHGGFRIY